MKALTIDLEEWGTKYILQINWHPNTKELVSIEVDFMDNGYDLVHWIISEIKMSLRMIMEI